MHETYGELAHLPLVNAHLLGLFTCTQAQTGDQVHDEEDEAGSSEGIEEAGDAVSQLVGKLDVMAVEPASVDLGEAVKMRYVVTVGQRTRLAHVLSHANSDLDRQGARKDCSEKTVVDLRCKECSQKISDDTAHTVLSEYIKGVVNVDEILDLSCVIAGYGTHDTKDDGRPRGDVSRGWCNGNESGDGTRAESDRGPLLLKSVI